jgi:hypothetical protein
MTAIVMIESLGVSLQGFFAYCEENNQSTAKELSSLFEMYFSLPECSHPPVKKAAVIKKAAAPKASKNEPLPREQQTAISKSYIESKEVKLPELRKLAAERGVSKTGNKATIVKHILEYEDTFKNTADQEGGQDQDEESEEVKFAIEKPKIRKESLSRPGTKHKVKVEKKHNLNLVHVGELEGYFVLNDENVAIGWIEEEDSESVEENEEVEIHALKEKHCEAAKKIRLEYIPSNNLDS